VALFHSARRSRRRGTPPTTRSSRHCADQDRSRKIPGEHVAAQGGGECGAHAGHAGGDVLLSACSQRTRQGRGMSSRCCEIRVLHLLCAWRTWKTARGCTPPLPSCLVPIGTWYSFVCLKNWPFPTLLRSLGITSQGRADADVSGPGSATRALRGVGGLRMDVAWVVCSPTAENGARRAGGR